MLREADATVAAGLSEALSVPWPVGRLLASRRLTTADAAASFMDPRLNSLADPFQLRGMASAVERIWYAIGAGQSIVVFGDFDADGVTSAALLVDVLRCLGAQTGAFLPCRFADGYGLKPGALDRCIATMRPDLIITVDCGTGSVEAGRVAAAAGVDLVVTDHHECVGAVIGAHAVVNPKLGEDANDVHALAGVGVAFKLCHALVKRGIEDGCDAVQGLDLRNWLPLVAIGTVADVVPLVGENRILVRHGLERLSRCPCVGLKALMDVAGVHGAVTTYHVGFVLGPRLNAAGRLENAHLALDLLLAQDYDEAKQLALALDAANSERQRIERETVDAAMEDVASRFKADRDLGIVVAAPGWHVGTIGLVASRLSARFHRPSVVISLDGEGGGRGSCRSIEALDVLEVLHDVRHHLLTFGGHRMAAGLNIAASEVDAFREAFNAACRIRLAGRDLRPIAYVDAEINLADANQWLYDTVRRLAPFGVNNARPLWQVNGVRLAGPVRRVGRGGKHLKMTLVSGGVKLDAVGFGLGDALIPDGSMDILFTLEENTFRGKTSLQLDIKDVRASSEG